MQFWPRRAKKIEVSSEATTEFVPHEHIPGMITVALCNVCGRRNRIRADGTMGKHYDNAKYKTTCTGSFQTPLKIVAQYHSYR